MKTLRFLPAALVLFAAPMAFGQMVVLGNGKAQTCYMSAKAGNNGSISALRTCTEALDNPALSRRDVAATHVNRGVLRMRRGDNVDAETDFQAALKINNALPEAHINHGVALYQDGRMEASLTAYDKAVALEPEDKMAALAFYNRALVHERLGNTSKAYYDFKAASERQPEWELPQNALERFTVTRRASS